MHSIETARLLLRPFSPTDAPAYHVAVFSDADVMRYLPGGVPLPLERAGAIIERLTAHRAQHGFGLWAMIHRADNRLIGHCGLQYIPERPEVELVYALAKAYWGRGLAGEAGHAALRYGFETLGLGRIVAVFVPDNRASERVMIKLGMAREGTLHAYDTELPCYAITPAVFAPGDAPYTLYI